LIYIGSVPRILLIAAAVLFASLASAQQTITLPTQDGGRLSADLYSPGEQPGDRAIVLAHGGRFNKESWAAQAHVLAAAGYQVLAIDFRGYGASHGPQEKDFDHAPFQLDILAAVRYLHTHGSKSVSVLGGSFGGAAAGDACIDARPGDPSEEIDRIILLGAAPNEPADKLKCPALFIVSRDDTNGYGPRLPGIQAQYDKAPQPKQLIILDGSAHAQYLFQTDQSPRVMREILHFLNSRNLP
jgi:pimeloyl-ACP methyl ester carboxylesterase